MKKALPLITLLASCAGGPQAAPERQVPAADEGTAVDILATTLEFDVVKKQARAIIDFEATDTVRSIRLEKGDLTIKAVSDPLGKLQWKITDAMLDVGVPSGTRQIRVDFSYNRKWKDGGALASSTNIHPDDCANLFPCNSSPADGAKYHVALIGLTPDQVAVHPSSIRAEAPSFMVAWAFGEYQYKELGKTEAGTTVGTYAFKKSASAMRSGTYKLLKMFEWFEKTIGPYAFGDRVASVEVDWGKKNASGREYHPFWHVSTAALYDQSVHAHEAAHGWFGLGVRMKCWEDLVFSEGITNYLVARVTEQVNGAWSGQRIWRSYRATGETGAVWPAGCNKTDPSELNTAQLHASGALFFKHLEKSLTRAKLDAVIASFYVANKGSAVGFEDFLDHIKATEKIDAKACAKAWLRPKNGASSSSPCRF